MTPPIPSLYVVNYRDLKTGAETLGSLTFNTHDDAVAFLAKRPPMPGFARIVRPYVPLDQANALADRATKMVNELELEVCCLREQVADLRLARAEIRQAMEEARASASLS